MKKFIYVAVMALVTVAFTACKSGYNGSEYYKDGKEVVVDYDKCTINGVKYDDQTEKCWMWTLKEKSSGTTLSFDYYVWCTQFELVLTCEHEMYACSKSGRVAEYAFIESPSHKDANSCLMANQN